MAIEEVRIALFLDYENLAIGARDRLGIQFDLTPISDALAERGRVVVRRAYADWAMFEADRKMLARQHVEMIEIPQKMGSARKNAADIKMAVDAMELAFERDYLTTFVFCTGDSDFTPLVHKLREHDKRVIGFGIKASTSALLPPACDEFLFYESLEGVEPRKGRGAANRGRKPEQAAAAAEEEERPPSQPTDPKALERVIGQTLAGLQRNTDGPILTSALKRAVLRKDPTFTESDFGFRAFGDLLRFLEKRRVVDLVESGSRGDPEVTFPEKDSGEEEAFRMMREVVEEYTDKEGAPALSGLKNKIRRRQPDFSEKSFGYNGFLQFCKAAATLGWVELEWDDDLDDYVVHALEDE
ncbi:MAG: NYN domain-containing protein [Planctomycetes bacterium]|nr:NYN domain-containing protein [Planctomycetota bacterium]